jgi:DNA-directed RNA polymerase subunit E'/Rpb7
MVHIEPKYLQRNMQAPILAKLKMNFEGKCSAEGFIQRNSITIINWDIGRIDTKKDCGGNYVVQFQADVCMPHPGQRFKAPVIVRSKVGIHAETPPIKVLIPRDLHIGNSDFEDVKIGEEIEFEVVGINNFKQQDKDIIIVAKLLSKIAAPVEAPLLSTLTNPLENLISAIMPGDSDVKQIITTPSEPEKPKKRKLRQSAGNIENDEQILSFKIGDA